MKNKKYLLLIFYCLVWSLSAQEKHSELVFLNDDSLVNLLSEIIANRKNCEGEKGIHYWFVEFKENQNIALSKIRREVLFGYANELDEILITVLKNNIVFILNRGGKKRELFLNTEFNFDLNKINHDSESVYPFEDFSFWIFHKKADNYYRLAKKNIWKECGDVPNSDIE